MKCWGYVGVFSLCGNRDSKVLCAWHKLILFIKSFDEAYRFVKFILIDNPIYFSF